jgi:AraC-like DNA-binding protein
MGAFRNQASMQQTKLFLWDYRVLYLGRFDGELVIRHTIDLLVVGVDALLQYAQTEPPQPVAALLIPAGAPARLTVRGRLALCTLDVFRIERGALLTEHSNHRFADCWVFLPPADTILRDLFRSFYETDSPAGSVHQRLRSVLGLPVWSPQDSPLDPRLVTCLMRMRQHVETGLCNRALAESVHLSQSRLEHLFKEQLGCTIGRMRAALRTGFADAAHFSRTFRALFGLQPTRVFGRQKSLSVYIG